MPSSFEKFLNLPLIVFMASNVIEKGHAKPLSESKNPQFILPNGGRGPLKQYFANNDLAKHRARIWKEANSIYLSCFNAGIKGNRQISCQTG